MLHARIHGGVAKIVSIGGDVPPLVATAALSRNLRPIRARIFLGKREVL